MRINREDLAWLAGFYEGEGCIYTRTDGRGIYLLIVQAQLEPIQRVRAILGFGRITRQVTKRGTEVWTWQTSGFERVQAGVAMVWAWLSPRRKAQARRALLEWLAWPGIRRVRREQPIQP